MKKRIFTLMAVIALSIFTACGSDKKDDINIEKSDLTAYDKTGYSISVTKNWAKTDNKNTDLSFLYKSSKNDFFTESITVLVQDLSTYDYTLDTYKEVSVSQYEELGYKIEECEKITIDGNEFYAITSYCENDDKKIYCRQLFTLRNKKAYIFTFSAEEADFKKLIKEVDVIFDTITFTDDVLTEETTVSAEQNTSGMDAAPDGASETSDINAAPDETSETSDTNAAPGETSETSQ